MRGKASKSLRWWTAGFVLVVALLVGIGFADRLVPAGWKAAGAISGSASLNFTDADGVGVHLPVRVSVADEQIGGITMTTWAEVVELPRSRSRTDLSTQTRDQAYAKLVDSWSASINPLRRPELAPVLAEAVASPGKKVRVVFPERRWAAVLMEVRKKTRLGGEGTCFWMLVLPAWLWLLCAKWKAVLWPRRVNACGTCGYDLAGLRGGAVCPECGKAS